MGFTRLAKLRILIGFLLCIVILNIVIRLRNNKSIHKFVKKHRSKVSLNHLHRVDKENESRNDSNGDKISWEDIDFINYELTRHGLGEHSEAVELQDPDEIKLNEDWLKKEGFYVNVSNKISFTRSLLDLRPNVYVRLFYFLLDIIIFILKL